jgi:hypothetical protein
MAACLLLLLSLPACCIRAATASTLVTPTATPALLLLLQASSIFPCGACAALPVPRTPHILLLLLLVSLTALLPNCSSISDGANPCCCCCCGGVVGFQRVHEASLPAWGAALTWRTLKGQCVAAGALPYVLNGITWQQVCTRTLLHTMKEAEAEASL